MYLLVKGEKKSTETVFEMKNFFVENDLPICNWKWLYTLNKKKKTQVFKKVRNIQKQPNKTPKTVQGLTDKTEHISFAFWLILFFVRLKEKKSL